MARIVPQCGVMYVFLILHLLWTLGVTPFPVRQRRDPMAAAVWLALVLLLPVVGTLLYLLTGKPESGETERDAKAGSGDDALSRIISAGCGTCVQPCNRLTLLHNGNNAFTSLITALQHAQNSIHLEYYIFRDDRIGRAIAEILIRKARAGVEVRLIYDAIGSWRLSRKTLRRLKEAGVQTVAWNPLRFPWFTPQATRRNHRKMVVTDGRVAYLGGINIANCYLDGDYMGKWRDEHLRMEGDAVGDLQRLFLADWQHATGETVEPADHIARHKIRERLPVQIAWSEAGGSRRTIEEACLTAIHGAKRCIRLSSPYFLPPPELLNALRMAVERGICVEVMIPTNSDSAFTDLLSESFIEDLLRTGVRLYRYDNGFLHAKLLMVDDRLASVGTANMDYRSLRDNLEVTAFIRDRATIEALSATFDGDLASCRRITRETWRPRPLRRLVGDLLRFVSPLM